MNSEPELLWPHLGFAWHAPLDYAVMQYDADWLLDVSQRLMPPEVRKAKVVPPPPGVRKLYGLGGLQYSVATCLAKLARTPKALDALNHCRKHDPAATAIRIRNFAVHLAALRELDRAAPPTTVARVWGIAKHSVYDYDSDQHREEAKHHLDQLCTLYFRRRPGKPQNRRAVLKLLDADMHHRAGLPWFKVRNKASKANGSKPTSTPKTPRAPSQTARAARR